MSFDTDAVFDLLPAIYRTRDADIGPTPGDGPLRALLSIIAEQARGIEESIEQLYDDQFIETCAEWVVPYIGDLIGYRAFDPQLQQRLGSARAEVANTIGFRRRKGTAGVLEELALDVTDWDAAVVEFFERLAITQYLNHVRVDGSPTAGRAESRFDQPGTVNVRRADRLELTGTPFDPSAHTADVRRIAGSRGRFNISNVGIFLWRVGSQQLTDSPAFSVDARRYLFNPLGANTQLFGAAERDPDVTHLAGPLDVPLPITRRALRRNLPVLYGAGRSLAVIVGGNVLPVEQVEACDLSDTGADPQTSAWAHAGQTLVAIDPVLGRVAFPADISEPVTVTFYYGALAAIGGGEYDREPTPPPAPVRHVPADRPDIPQALTDLAGAGTVEVTGSGRYAGPAFVTVLANQRLELRAANESRPLIALSGDLVVSGGDSGEVTLSGLLIAGGRILVPAQVNGQPNLLQKLRLVDCTLIPGGSLTRAGRPGPLPISIEVSAANVSVEIERCIVGGLRVSDESVTTLAGSVVDALAPEQVAYAATDGLSAGGALVVDDCTVVGKLRASQLTASNSIFFARLAAADTWSVPLRVDRRQMGYARYCYLPLEAHAPPRYRCVPAAGADTATLVPRFASSTYADPAYLQLHAACPIEIRAGAEDRGEMGVYHHLYAPQREAGLRVRLDEYLRFGLEAGVFYAS